MQIPTTTINQKDGIPMAAQTARAVITCVECQKPRVVYSRYRVLLTLLYSYIDQKS